MKYWFRFFSKYKLEVIFLAGVYLSGLYFRLLPRIQMDPHLLTFNADIWYRVAISQYIYDHGHFPAFSIRYLSYTFVPEWYPPIFPYFLSFLAKLANIDIPTVSSRIIPFFESLTPLPLYMLARYLYGRRVAIFSTLALCLTPCFVYWNGISDPQSFITFILPLLILMCAWHGRQDWKAAGKAKRFIYIMLFGCVLAVSFATHLMYFLMIIILSLTTLALIVEKKATLSTFIDLLAAIFISQALTVLWWFPRRLYWWWLNGLVTSSGFQVFTQQLNIYGVSAAVIGVLSFLFILLRAIFKTNKTPYLLVPLFWVILPLLETENEYILKLIKRMDLTWSPLFKPLESFRFQPFLAQPLALCAGLSVVLVIDALMARKTPGDPKKLSRSAVYAFCAVLLGAILFCDIQFAFNFKSRMQAVGITVGEYKAALWFRENSRPTDRIVGDYYRSQMLAGVCAGKALLGLQFPLRNVDVKYINQHDAQQLRDDVYKIYDTPVSENAYRLMKRYGLTHLFVSKTLDKYGNFGSLFHPGFGAAIDREKFKDVNFFDIVYNKDDVLIIRAK